MVVKIHMDGLRAYSVPGTTLSILNAGTCSPLQQVLHVNTIAWYHGTGEEIEVDFELTQGPRDCKTWNLE